MEAFSPENEHFVCLRPEIPTVNEPSWVYVDNSLLVVHSKSNIRRFAAGEAGQLVKQEPDTSSPAIIKLQNSHPVVDAGNRRFYLVWDGKCLCFNMDDGQHIGEPVA